MNKIYILLKEIRSWEKYKAALLQCDTDLLHKKKMEAYKGGSISYEQAIRLEKKYTDTIL